MDMSNVYDMRTIRIVLRWGVVITLSALISLTVLSNLDENSKRFYSILTTALLFYLTKIIWNKIGWNSDSNDTN